jgi:hypothetical protein
MVTINRSDVQDVFGEQTVGLSTQKQTALVGVAERLTEDVFGGRVSRLGEIEGDTEDFAAYVGAHLWEIAERKRLNDEFQTGFSPDVDSLRSDPQSALAGTPYGNVALMMIRDRANIGIIRADH